MGVGEDWLTGAAEATETESTGTAPVETEASTLPTIHAERNAMITQAWNELTPTQRRYLELLERHEFNDMATRKSRYGWGKGLSCPVPQTVTQWKRQPAFKLVLQVLKSAAAREVLHKDDIVVNAAAIRKMALTPKPILYQGSPTGYTEIQGDVALRANEQLAKLGGHLKQEDVMQGQQGPALLVQIIQKEGQVVDVTPRGVTIDLPGPHGS